MTLMRESAEPQSPSAVLPVKQDQTTFRFMHPSVCSASLEASMTDVNMQLI